MKDYGYDKAMSVPAEKRNEVFKAIQEKITMAAHQSAPTAMEQQESADF